MMPASTTGFSSNGTLLKKLLPPVGAGPGLEPLHLGGDGVAAREREQVDAAKLPSPVGTGVGVGAGLGLGLCAIARWAPVAARNAAPPAAAPVFSTSRRLMGWESAPRTDRVSGIPTPPFM